MVLDRYRIAKGLVGSFEVVLDEPLGDLAVKDGTVRGEVPELQELAVERPIEPFIEGVVGGGLEAGVPVRQPEHAVFLLVQNPELHLAVADMRPAQSQDAELLHAGDLPPSRLMGPPAMLLKRGETEGIVTPLPFVKALPRDAKMAAGESRIPRLAVMVHPGKPFLRLFAEHGNPGELTGARQDAGDMHMLPSIPRFAAVIYSFSVYHLATPECHRCISSSAAAEGSVLARKSL